MNAEIFDSFWGFPLALNVTQIYVLPFWDQEDLLWIERFRILFSRNNEWYCLIEMSSSSDYHEWKWIFEIREKQTQRQRKSKAVKTKIKFFAVRVKILRALTASYSCHLRIFICNSQFPFFFIFFSAFCMRFPFWSEVRTRKMNYNESNKEEKVRERERKKNCFS